MELAEDGVAREVGEGVVHPAHVPLEAEAEPAHVERARDHGPGGRLLGHGLHVGVLAVDVLVEPAQEGDRLEVLAAPVGVRHPLARLARVVEVQHRRHRVHPQAVGVEDVEPEHRARQQEAADLVAPVVEDEAVPVGVVALAAVGVLVEVRPVEVGEAVLVGREVRRHPVEDDPDPALVEGVHQVHQVLGRALAAGGGEVPEALVAPRAVEGVLHHRQELHVGEAHLLHVVGEHGCQLAVGEEAGGLGGVAAPGAEVHLVGRARGGERLARAPCAHPLAVPPRVVEVPDHGPGARRRLVAEGEGVGLVDLVPAEAGGHVVLVHGPGAQPRRRSPRRGPTGLAGAGDGGRPSTR